MLYLSVNGKSMAIQNTFNCQNQVDSGDINLSHLQNFFFHNLRHKPPNTYRLIKVFSSFPHVTECDYQAHQKSEKILGKVIHTVFLPIWHKAKGPLQRQMLEEIFFYYIHDNALTYFMSLISSHTTFKTDNLCFYVFRRYRKKIVTWIGFQSVMKASKKSLS